MQIWNMYINFAILFYLVLGAKFPLFSVISAGTLATVAGYGIVVDTWLLPTTCTSCCILYWLLASSSQLVDVSTRHSVT